MKIYPFKTHQLGRYSWWEGVEGKWNRRWGLNEMAFQKTQEVSLKLFKTNLTIDYSGHFHTKLIR